MQTHTLAPSLAARVAAMALLGGLGLMSAGCTSVNGRTYWAWEEPPRTEEARSELVRQQTQRDLDILKHRLEGVELSNARLVERLDRLDAAARENSRLRDEIAAMRRDLDQAKGERDALRKEIVDDLTTRINAYMSKLNAAVTPPPDTTKPVTQTGYRHTVAAGQTLTDIAKAYRTTTTAIGKANNLKDGRLRAGQVLFIPESTGGEP